MKLNILLGLSLAGLGLSGCAGSSESVVAPSGKPATYVAPQDQGPVSGVGIEARDIIAVTDEMVRDILASPQVAARITAPRVLMDSSRYENRSSQRINKDLLIDRLRISLQRASQGKLSFVGQEYAKIAEQQRALKRSGTTDVGTTGLTKATAGIDYVLVGRINSLDSNDSTGQAQRYTQITFDLLDAESLVSVWTNMYEFQKAGLDDVIYR